MGAGRGGPAHQPAGGAERPRRQPRTGDVDRQADLLGADALVGFDYTFRRPDDLDVQGTTRGPRYAFMRVRANSIEGGTSEIMRNILGEQVLGLPGEPRVDKDLPWIQVPRS